MTTTPEPLSHVDPADSPGDVAHAWPEAPPVTGAWMPGAPLGRRRLVEVGGGRPFHLEGGATLPSVTVAYEAWGELDAEGANAILVCHALTGDSHAAGRAGEGHPGEGWWDGLIGPGRAIDTDRYFVVCANVLGGCQGTTGPASTDPRTGRPYGSAFPVVTIRDIVRSQALLADTLGIARWLGVVGGSMGGMQSLEWAVMFPERVGSMVSIASTAASSALQIAWSMVGRRAIEGDPHFAGGDYYDAAPGHGPHRGLKLAREIAQIHYRSDEVFHERFGRRELDRLDRPGGFRLDQRFDVEGYLDYHGDKLVRRFDANSYLRLNKAMDLHDLARGRGGVRQALARITCPSLIMSITSDMLYVPREQHLLRDTLTGLGRRCGYHEIVSPHGHDAFLIELAQIRPVIEAFLDAMHEERVSSASPTRTLPGHTSGGHR
ncbi:MAG: homoserine O-acetyltransferase [Microthrixaceae bacterium]